MSLNLCDYYLDQRLVEGRGGKVALLSGEAKRTYAEVADETNRVAAYLRRAGVRPEERVLILLPDCFEFASAFFGILRVGAVFAMVNPLLKRDALAYYFAYTKARVAIVHASCLPEIEPLMADARFCERLLVVGGDAGQFDDWKQALGAEDPHGSLATLEATDRDDLAGWLFTSGSTGHPKGCVHRHGDFEFNTERYALQVVQYEENDVTLSVPKLFFGYATGTNLMFPFRVGATSILFEGRSTPDELFDQMAKHKPTLLTSVPTMINNMLNSPRMNEVDWSRVRVCLSAGEALPPALYRAFRDRTGTEILDGIGSAEMFHIYISNYLDDVTEGSLGKLVPGYDAEIIDDEGRCVPDGEPGRLRVRGGSTALCYWGDRAKSEETFQADWCTSADLFRKDAEGYYFYEGRSDDLIKVSGIWTSPLEIENCLLGHPDVAEVCVVGCEDENELVKPYAFVVPTKSGDDALATDLKQWVKDRLAPHKYPRWFDWRAELPKNDRGKVARKVLRQELAEKGPVA